MSLKALHIVFVTACTLMCLVCSGWAAYNYLEGGAGPSFLVGAVASVIVAIALVIYGRFVLKKLSKLSYL